MGKLTQAKKLATVLEHGSFEKMSMESVLKENNDILIQTNGRYSAYSDENMKGLVRGDFKCYRFTPHDKEGDLETVEQITPNLFTLIDLVYNEIIQL